MGFGGVREISYPIPILVLQVGQVRVTSKRDRLTDR